MKVILLEEYKKRKRDSIFNRVDEELKNGSYDINVVLDKIKEKYENVEKL